MLNQYDARWKNIKLGTSSVTIGSHGCNITSICQGLIDKGYNFTPATLNTRLVQNKSYSSGNLVDPNLIATTNKDIFILGRKENWSDSNVRKYLADKSFFVVCEVDGQGIGGTGQHFVLLRSLVEKNGVITNSYIGDPWGGLENLTSVRYSKYGYLKSLRVYQVKINNQQQKEDNMNELLNYLDVKDLDEAKGKLKEHLGEKDGKCGWGSNKDMGYLGSERERRAYFEKLSVDLANEHDGFKGEINQLKRELESCQKQYAELDKALNDKNDDFIKQTNKAIKLAEDLKGCQKLANTSNNVSDEIIKELKDLRDEVKRLEEINTKLTEDNAKLNKDLVKLKEKAKDNICTIKKAILNLIDEIMDKINHKER